ncbi:MAG: hypothetical protein OXC60_02285 [Litoreibacter sp.]|nr:hypothetical protein [Litoreibacter sp.]
MFRRDIQARNQAEGAVPSPVRPDGLAILAVVRATAMEDVLGRHKALLNPGLRATPRTGDGTAQLWQRAS